jgi:hypothetical protein
LEDRIEVEAGLDVPINLDATIKKWPVEDGRSRRGKPISL